MKTITNILPCIIIKCAFKLDVTTLCLNSNEGVNDKLALTTTMETTTTTTSTLAKQEEEMPKQRKTLHIYCQVWSAVLLCVAVVVVVGFHLPRPENR